MAAVVRSRFYVYLAVALAALMVLGFTRTYFLRAWFEVPPINWLLHLHALVFTAWFALYVVQTRLIAAHRVHLHMRLGVIGVILAAAVVVLGLATVIDSADAPRMRPMGFNSAQFTIFPLLGILPFGALVAAAVAYRLRPQIHKRLMTLAMISVLGPAVARLILVLDQRESFLALQTTVAAAFVIWCLLADWMKHRIVHPIYAVGGILLVISWPLRAAVAQTAGWERVGLWMAQLGS